MENPGNALEADIHEVWSDDDIPWNELRGGTALVTGATGLVGGALIRALSAANAERGLGMRLIAHGRNKDKGDALALEYGLAFIGGDIRHPFTLTDAADRLDYIFHCAAITKSADMLAKPVDVVTTAVEGTKNMLELARGRRCKAFVFLSSMEVYRQTEIADVGEADLGYLDLSNPRSSYPESKRFGEMLCVSYAAQHGVPVKIARLAQTFGTGVPADDARVFAQFARNAVAGENIELHTEGKSRGNYCHISDAARGLLTVLIKGKTGEAYNVANPAASATIREMAELVANEICGGRIKVVVKASDDLRARGYAPDAGYTLKADKLEALGWKPKHGLGEMYRRMLADWQGR
jgi:nucleoside-diphosphate-sugar epimerase